MNFNSAKKYFKNGVDFVLETAVTETDKKLKESEDKGYSDGIELGITNTIIALYSANVNDKDIIRITRECWKINETEIKDKLIEEKRTFIIKKLREYLKLQGMTEKDIREFFYKNSVTKKIKQNYKLLSLKDNIEELVKFLEN